MVREFIRQVFRDDPDADIPVLLASELATNSVLYSWSRLGGTMTVTVSDIEDGMVRVEVADAGGLSVPVPQDESDDWAESGHGLRLVKDLSDQLGYRIEADGGLVTWFVVPFGGRDATGLWQVRRKSRRRLCCRDPHSAIRHPQRSGTQGQR